MAASTPDPWLATRASFEGHGVAAPAAARRSPAAPDACAGTTGAARSDAACAAPGRGPPPGKPVGQATGRQATVRQAAVGNAACRQATGQHPSLGQAPQLRLGQPACRQTTFGQAGFRQAAVGQAARRQAAVGQEAVAQARPGSRVGRTAAFVPVAFRAGAVPAEPSAPVRADALPPAPPPPAAPPPPDDGAEAQVTVLNPSDGGFWFWLLRFYAFGFLCALGALAPGRLRRVPLLRRDAAAHPQPDHVSRRRGHHDRRARLGRHAAGRAGDRAPRDPPLRAVPAAAGARFSGGRGPALLPARRHRLPRRRPRAGREPARRRGRPGRLDHHPAGREVVPVVRADDPAQDPRGDPGAPPGTRGTASATS